MRLFVLFFLLAGAALAGEYAVLASGARLRIDRHEADGAKVRLYHGTGFVELDSAVVRSHRFPLTYYAGGIGALTLLAMFGFMQQALRLEVQGWKLVLFALVFLPCASQLAVALMNWLST